MLGNIYSKPVLGWLCLKAFQQKSSRKCSSSSSSFDKFFQLDKQLVHLSLVVIMILLPEPKQSHPPASFSNLSLSSTSSRTKGTFFRRSLRFISYILLLLLPPNSVSNSSCISKRRVFCRSSRPLILFD